MEQLTAEQVEADWRRALDSASEAVRFCSAEKLLTPAYAAHEVVIIEAERKWLERLRPELRRLFPPAPVAS